ncbi:SPOR domain-containing protein [Pseudochelatococcus sp. B33]
MRDRDDLEEQRWQPASTGPSRDNDPLAELARIVGYVQPQADAAAAQPAPQAGAPAGQQDWINEIEQAFAQVNPKPRPVSAPRQPQESGDQEVPAWLRSPAVPQLPVPEGQQDPRLHPDAFAQEFTQALDEASGAAQTGYFAQDAYQLAAGGAEALEAGHRADAPAAQAEAWSPAGHAAQDAAAHGYGAQSYGVYDDLEDEYSANAGDGEEDDYAYQQERPGLRRKLVVAALALGLGAVAVAGVFVFRGGETVDGEPPVVSADSQPVKVEPETPGGVEVPNTNRAIYEHTNQAPTGEDAVVVDDREQPVDINQMIAQQNAAAQERAAQAQAQAETQATTTTTQTTTAPPAGAADVKLPEAPEPTSPAIAALGEPRRVRTVSVRPDGSILPSDAPASPEAPTAAAPTIEELASATPSPSVPSPTTPAVPAPETPAGGEAPAQESAAVVPTVGPVPRPASVNRPATRAPMQLGPMAISPQSAGSQVARAPSPAQAPAPAAQPSQPAAAGAFTVQLAAPGSENEARNLFATLQRRHGELSGYTPNIVRAESGGRTIYRLRVGAFQSRDQATALCVRIQAAGGQCFVARN